MAKFSKKSKEILSHADIRLQQICNEVIKHYDCSVICSVRGKEAQNHAYRRGFSKLKYPDSLHNHKPSLAIDVIPYPSGYIQDDDSEIIKLEKKLEFYKLATWMFSIANKYGIKIIWGGLWKSFKDLPHWQLHI